MKRFLLPAATAVLLVVSTAAHAQSTGNNYGGTPPWSFRSDNERVARTNQANTIQSVRRGVFSTSAGGSGQGGAGWGASSTAVSNYFSVTNNVSCYSSGGAVGSPVTCTGGTNSVNGTNQTTTDSSISSDTTLTGNTITTNNSRQRVGND